MSAHTGLLVRELADAKGLPNPVPRIYIRAFKHEKELEIWGATADGPFQLVNTFPIARQSGRPGPKRREGDLQVPEGCYVVAVFNPQSKFHLSLGLNYPNASDKVRSDQARPGYDIYIHGGSASVGCLAMTDPVIEQIYLMAEQARSAGQKEIRVDIFPARPGPAWEELKRRHPQHVMFWREIEPAYTLFEQNKRPAEFTVDPDGRYVFGPAPR